MEKDTGARALRAIIEEFMLDIMYEIPKDDSIGEVVITREYIEHTGGPRILMRGQEIPLLDDTGVKEECRSWQMQRSFFDNLGKAISRTADMVAKKTDEFISVQKAAGAQGMSWRPDWMMPSGASARPCMRAGKIKTEVHGGESSRLCGRDRRAPDVRSRSAGRRSRCRKGREDLSRLRRQRAQGGLLSVCDAVIPW